MAQDVAKINAPATWPHTFYLPMKTQPWVIEAAGGKMRFGQIDAFDKLTVLDTEGETHTTTLSRIW